MCKYLYNHLRGHFVEQLVEESVTDVGQIVRRRRRVHLNRTVKKHRFAHWCFYLANNFEDKRLKQVWQAFNAPLCRLELVDELAYNLNIFIVKEIRRKNAKNFRKPDGFGVSGATCLLYF